MANVTNTAAWILEPHQVSRFLHVGEMKIPVYVRPFKEPNSEFSMLYPAGRLDGFLWKAYIGACRANSLFDPGRRSWIWSKLAVEKATTADGARPAPPILTKEQKLALREQREADRLTLEKNLAELSKLENVPESEWPRYLYPAHYKPCDPVPTALQRIIVSRYWDKPACLAGASVGTGKSRMVIDMLNARASADSKPLNDSARIVLLIAPLALHENWVREFAKWKSPGVTWRVHKFKPSKDFWEEAEASATHMFDGKKIKTGGVVIIATPNILARGTLTEHLDRAGWIPSFIAVDEAHRFFRKPTNNGYKRLYAIRQKAWAMVALSGTPTAKLPDWYSLEELILGTRVDAHWQNATFTDYEKLGDTMTFWESGLFRKGWSFERGVQEYHAFRIGKGRAMLADKNYYLRDALPGLDQQEIGDFADLRLSFGELFEQYPDQVQEAFKMQQDSSTSSHRMSPAVMASTLLLRMQQCAANSPAAQQLLEQFIKDELEPDESCIFWVMFRNEPCEELPTMVKYLTTVSPTVWLMGQMTETDRWRAVDAFQSGSHRFMVAQVESGGVGLNLTRARKMYFNSIPFSYLTTQQAIGRIHRIGQSEDCTSYFAMHHPIAAFARHIYDKRVSLNETIPSSLGTILSKFSVDKPQIVA